MPSPVSGSIGTRIRIVQVAAGGGLVRVSHTLLLTDLGQVLSFGTAMYGQLGHGFSAGKTLQDEIRPKFVDALKPYRCTYISAGELHSAAVTEDGDLYTWGDGFCGQLGLGNKRPRVLPEQVTLGGLEDECVESVSCGYRHTLCVTEDGECFTFGLGHFGVLGRSYDPYQYSLVIDGEEVEGLLQEEVSQPDVGQFHAREDNEAGSAITDEMRAHLDLLGNLTLDDPSNQCYPVVVDVLEGINIVGTSAGHRHSMLLDDAGGIYTFGCGKNGKLGHGDEEKQEYPLKVLELRDKNIKISQISAGVDSSLALSTTGEVYSWGKATKGRIGHVGEDYEDILSPLKVNLPIKSASIDCAYMHSVIIGLDGSIYMCGEVGINGDDDGQIDESPPRQIANFNVWHRTPEAKEEVKREKWKKYGKYELKGRSKAMAEADKAWNA